MIANYWEKLATLSRRGHLDMVLVWDYLGNECVLTWYRLETYIKASREDFGDPRVWEHFEWLAGWILDRDRRSGVASITRDQAAASPEQLIGVLEEILRVEVALRSPETMPASAV